jgi:UDPglucose--hexose-1-phosphate uridylyltransferase
VAAKYDALFDEPMPYMMVFHQLHEEAEGFHFHVEFYPLERAKGKLKYAASSETGAGLWLNDAYPERTIELLREKGPQNIVLPGVTLTGFTRRTAGRGA